jgi:hypothetical protein
MARMTWKQLLVSDVAKLEGHIYDRPADMTLDIHEYFEERFLMEEENMSLRSADKYSKLIEKWKRGVSEIYPELVSKLYRSDGYGNWAEVETVTLSSGFKLTLVEPGRVG